MRGMKARVRELDPKPKLRSMKESLVVDLFADDSVVGRE